MRIIEHKNSGDVDHMMPYEEMDNYIKTKLEPEVYFTIKAHSTIDHDLTYKTPPKA